MIIYLGPDYITFILYLAVHLAPGQSFAPSGAQIVTMSVSVSVCEICLRFVSSLCILSFKYFVVQTEPKILRLV